MRVQVTNYQEKLQIAENLRRDADRAIIIQRSENEKDMA